MCVGVSRLLCLSTFPSAAPRAGVRGSAPFWLLPGPTGLGVFGDWSCPPRPLGSAPVPTACPRGGQLSLVPQWHLPLSEQASSPHPPLLSPRRPPAATPTPKPPCASPWGPWLLGERHELPGPPDSSLCGLHASCPPRAQPARTCAGLTALRPPAQLSLRPARPAQSPSECCAWQAEDGGGPGTAPRLRLLAWGCGLRGCVLGGGRALGLLPHGGASRALTTAQDPAGSF